ncbi:recombinase family protein [Piscirickettsia salmonis]|uniref:recombinase family protein n=1 Tax=Piscirickettsia salmonis TaxID=1238 RepID=UPI003EBFADA0
MQIGYARISTAEQSLDLQLDALKNAGCEKIFHDVASGAKSKRPGLDDCLSQIQEGDSLVVWRIDRLGRSISHLVNTVNELQEKNIHFKSLSDGCIDTTTASGELMFNLFASLAQRKRRYLGRYFAHPMMQNRRAKRDDYKPSAVRVTQRCVP